jgi:hypothetical protein
VERVDEYEVLLDRGTWRSQDDEGNPPAGLLECGRDAAGTPLYAAVTDEEEWGTWPREYREGQSSNWWRWFLVEPIEPEPHTYPWEATYDYEAYLRAEAAKKPAAADTASPHPVVSALDLRKEVVVISNPSTDEVDLAGWTVHDESPRKPYTFPAGTILGPGASVLLRSGPTALRTGPGELTWTTASVWNDRGDTAILRNPEGKQVSTSID